MKIIENSHDALLTLALPEAGAVCVPPCRLASPRGLLCRALGCPSCCLGIPLDMCLCRTETHVDSSFS